MSIFTTDKPDHHPTSIIRQVKKQSTIASRTRKKGARSTKLPRHKTLIPGRTSPECSHSSSAFRTLTSSPCPLFPPRNPRTCHTDQRRVNPDLVSTRPLMLELSHLQTHRPPTTSQPARLPSIPLRNT